MGPMEALLNYLLVEPRRSSVVCLGVWLVTILLIGCICFFAGTFLFSGFWLIVVAIIPAIIVFLLSLFISNYQVDEHRVFLPAPYLFSALVFFVVLGFLRLIFS